MFLKVALKDATTSFGLRWSLPEDPGGANIVDYEISYDYAAVRAKVNVADLNNLVLFYSAPPLSSLLSDMP